MNRIEQEMRRFERVVVEANQDPRGKPDCWILTRTGRHGGAVVAVYKTEEGLRAHFARVLERQQDVDLYSWWFDDDEEQS